LGEVLLVAQASDLAARMGFQSGQLVLEIGHGSDCDSALRSDIEKTIGSTILSGDVNEVVDAVILWFRESDGDLVDELVDGLTYLSETGPIWVLTPKAGREGHVEASDIQDAAPTAGLTRPHRWRLQQIGVQLV